MSPASSENPKLYEFGYVAISFAFSDEVEISQLKPCKYLHAFKWKLYFKSVDKVIKQLTQASAVIIVLTSTHAVSVSAGRLHFPVLTKAMTGVIRECVTSLSMALQCE